MSDVRRPMLTRLVLVLILLALVYFAFATVNNALHSHRLGQEEARLGQEIQQLQEETRRLEALRRYLNSDEYIESLARQQLGMMRPGETPIRVLPANTEMAPQGPAPASGLWWDAFQRR